MPVKMSPVIFVARRTEETDNNASSSQIELEGERKEHRHARTPEFKKI